MAKARTSKPGSRGSRSWWIAAIVLAVLAGAGWHYVTPARAYAHAATSYSARVACSCRFVAGRSLEDCEKDKLAGMEFVTLVEDPSTRTVTARFPLIAVDNATYREGFGCVLEKWED